MLSIGGSSPFMEFAPTNAKAFSNKKTVRNHRLERFLMGTMRSPPETVVCDDETALVVWSTVLQFFGNMSTTAVISLHYKLQSLKKGDDSMRVYLTHLARFGDQPEVLPISANVAQRTGCQLYGKNGHLVDNCWHRFDQDFPGVTSSSKAYSKDQTGNAYYSVCETKVTECECCNAQNSGSQVDSRPQALVSTAAHERWVVDSGAIYNVTPDEGVFSHKDDYNRPCKLVVGNGVALDVKAVGNTTLCSSSRALLLSDLLHVPKITNNLLSVSKLARDNNTFFEFHAHECCVRDEDTGIVLLRGKEENGLYSFTVDPQVTALVAEASPLPASRDLYELWH
ncbi:uncharacterized protein LOC120144921 [Hibiscus syriacus]|uniref:uncharacterized protein LOC120144921 n=1 Tax=Hibiscus syriacus TaxID=106335 RepID=UPI00192450EF|nr:uncharacterized protein LOC120144921 [Hibiscus syriacus]